MPYVDLRKKGTQERVEGQEITGDSESRLNIAIVNTGQYHYISYGY